MSASSWSLLAVYLAVLLTLSWPLGRWIARLCAGNLPRWMQAVESPLYKLAGTAPDKSMNWIGYAMALLAFNVLGVLAVYALQRFQAVLPLNPAATAAVSPDAAFNTAISFVTNTDWQGYSGEQTMSYLTQMLGLGVQNFVSAATGIAVVFALFRGPLYRPGRQFLGRHDPHHYLVAGAFVAGICHFSGRSGRDSKL